MVDIGEGFVVAVDSGSLRLAAGHAELVADDLASAAFEVYGAEAEGWGAPFHGMGWRLSGLHQAVRDTAGQLRYAADVYDAAEAAWTLETYGCGTAEGAAAIAELDRLAEQYADADEDPIADAEELRAQLAAHRLDGVTENLAAAPDVRWTLTMLGSPGLGALASAVLPPPGVVAPDAYTAFVGQGRGVVRRGQKLGKDPTPQPISVKGETPHASDRGAPEGLEGAAERIPEGPDDLVRIETYTFDDGHEEHAVYVQGTREMTQDGDWNVIPLPEDGRDPSDMESNGDVYLADVKAESYRVLEQALEDAGVDPGEPVHAFGHSQGGMLVERLASEDELEVDTVVSYATPQQADLDDATVHVNLRYADDPVAGLAGGGVAGRAGGPGSLVISDTFDPGPDPYAVFEPHLLENYKALAAEADASSDPRLEGIRGVFDHLAEADRMRTSTWNGTRVDPDAE